MKKILSCMFAVIALAMCAVNVSSATASCTDTYYDVVYSRCGMGHLLCDVSATLYYTAIDGVLNQKVYHVEYEYHHGEIKLYNVCPFDTSIASV